MAMGPGVSATFRFIATHPTTNVHYYIAKKNAIARRNAMASDIFDVNRDAGYCTIGTGERQGRKESEEAG